MTTNAQAALMAVCALNASRLYMNQTAVLNDATAMKRWLDDQDKADQEACREECDKIVEETYGITNPVDLGKVLKEQHFLTDEHTMKPRCACGFTVECNFTDSSQRQARYLIRNHVNRETNG